MKMRSIKMLLFIVTLLTSLSVNAQEIGLYFILQKGTAKSIDDKTRSILEFLPGKREILSLYSTVYLQPNSYAIIYNINGSREIGGKNEEKYNVKELASALNEKTGTNAAVRFFEFMNYTYAEMQKTQSSKGSVIGAATRGEDKSVFFFLPGDSLLIISDTLRLRWSSSEYFRLLNKLVVVNITSRDTIYNDYPNDSNILLRNLKPGEYNWTGRFKAIDGRNISMINIFFVPSDSIKKNLQSDLAEFSTTISFFSPEMRESLYYDFLNKKRIYFPR
jgi:hypothetical protein